ncbi:hypothetical protein B0H19DRAFT_1057081 [Mycena capillaripes]|nr:hypothetical protein B0H19DRAFT_1057081 [Mycena capillaripes]
MYHGVVHPRIGIGGRKRRRRWGIAAAAVVQAVGARRVCGVRQPTCAIGNGRRRRWFRRWRCVWCCGRVRVRWPSGEGDTAPEMLVRREELTRASLAIAKGGCSRPRCVRGGRAPRGFALETVTVCGEATGPAWATRNGCRGRCIRRWCRGYYNERAKLRRGHFSRAARRARVYRVRSRLGHCERCCVAVNIRLGYYAADATLGRGEAESEVAKYCVQGAQDWQKTRRPGRMRADGRARDWPVKGTGGERRAEAWKATARAARRPRGEGREYGSAWREASTSIY